MTRLTVLLQDRFDVFVERHRVDHSVRGRDLWRRDGRQTRQDEAEERYTWNRTSSDHVLVGPSVAVTALRQSVFFGRFYSDPD